MIIDSDAQDRTNLGAVQYAHSKKKSVFANFFRLFELVFWKLFWIHFFLFDQFKLCQWIISSCLLIACDLDEVRLQP